MKDTELIREAADIIGAAGYMQPRHVGLLRDLADRMEAQSKQEQESVGFARDDKFGGIELHLTDHGYLSLKHGDIVFTYPPDAQAKIAELEAAFNSVDATLGMANDRVAELEAQLAEYKADAERYRWLREKCRTSELDTFGLFIGVDSPLKPSRWALYEEEADKVIDAAIAKVKP